MSKYNEIKSKLQAAWKKTEPFRKKTAEIFRSIWQVLSIVGVWLFRFRGLFMSIPVVIAALWLAVKNNTNLPEQVGILIQSTGDYQWMVERGTAVMIPLLVTGGCLVLMLCSRRTVYPWLISVFSLVLPLLIYITNVFPA